MTFHVRISGRAECDVDTIFDWLAQRSKDGAIRWYEAYFSSLRLLPSLAPGSAKAPEAEQFGIDLRQIFFKTRKGRTYRSLIVFEGNVIHLVGVRGPGQNVAKIEDLDLP